jgi:hypothetical protein
MRACLTAIAFIIAGSASAQSPEGQANFDLNKCVEDASARYAALPDSLSDVATAAFASCSERFDAMSDALDKSPQAAVKPTMLRDMRQKAIERGMAKAAEVRLQPK